MRIGPYDTHPAADAFPMMQGPDFVALVDDVKRRGLIDPIVVDQHGALVDGRNRARALLELGRLTVELDVGTGATQIAFADDEQVVSYVVSRNLHRRHLTTSQRAVIADRLATIAHGAHRRDGAITQADAANLLRVSERSVRTARELRESGRSDLVDAVAAGDKTLSRAAREARRDESASRLRAADSPPPDGPWTVVGLDPPWRYEKNATMSDVERRGEVDYPDMATADVIALDVPRILADDAVVFLWFTNAHVPDAVDVCRAWGLSWKTVLTWRKPRIGTGDYLRGQTEHCAVLVRGRPTITLAGQSTILDAPTREHSRKPEEFYALVDSLVPGPKLELFAREQRDGWTCHGADVGAKFKEAR